MCTNGPFDAMYEILKKSLAHFNNQEQYLIQNDLSERCICARFAMHLTQFLQETVYQDYIVDVEYNRGADGCERAIKRIDDTPITVDLIVHKRGADCHYGFDNLLCIEMKKSENRHGCDGDENRLQKMTGPDYGFCYKLGVMLIIDGKDKQLKIKSLFANGRKIEGDFLAAQ